MHGPPAEHHHPVPDTYEAHRPASRLLRTCEHALMRRLLRAATQPAQSTKADTRQFSYVLATVPDVTVPISRYISTARHTRPRRASYSLPPGPLPDSEGTEQEGRECCTRHGDIGRRPKRGVTTNWWDRGCGGGPKGPSRAGTPPYWFVPGRTMAPWRSFDSQAFWQSRRRRSVRIWRMDSRTREKASVFWGWMRSHQRT